jgi:methionine-rich copper-binding protein CopC
MCRGARPRLAGVLPALAGALLLLSAAMANAHSLLLAASPASGSTVRAPERLTLRFNNRIEKRLSRIRVVAERGASHDLAVLVSAGAPDVVEANVPALAPGRYGVEWQVLSADGHLVTGRYTFHVTP